jgi:hypothetical protein
MKSEEGKIRQVIFDKRLYGKRFLFVTMLPLLLALIVQLTVEILTSSTPWVFYIPYLFVTVFVVLISAFLSKNQNRKNTEFLPMGYITIIASIFMSGISIYFSFIFRPENPLFSVIINTVIMVFAQAFMAYSLLNLFVIGSRSSVLYSIDVKTEIIKKSVEKWEKELNIPNSTKIISHLEECKYLIDLFEKGFFNLTVVWSCNIIGNVMDDATEVIISECPEKLRLFRIKKIDKIGNEFLTTERYPVQLTNIGFNVQRNSKEFNLEMLWHIRNDIAHRNSKPTFFQTIETLKVLMAFLDEGPKLLNEQYQIAEITITKELSSN